jgi:hypothetical protein
MKLPKKNSNFKTIFLDLDETLIHCDEHSNNYTVKLNFPLENGGTLAVLVLLLRLESESDPTAKNFWKNCRKSLRLSSLPPAVPPTQMLFLIILTLIGS